MGHVRTAHKPKNYARLAWVDRFNRPTLADLRAGLKAADAALFDDARKRLLEFEGVWEQMAWHGENWHWAIEYRLNRDSAPLAVLVPSPTDLQLAVPMDPEFVQTLPLRRMKRVVRDGLDLASEPFHSHWAIWTLQGVSLLLDLQDVVARKLQHLSKRAG